MSVFNQSRSTVIRLIFIGLFVIILAQLINLQLISGKYKQAAMDNAVYPKVVYPNRGIIYDRKNRAILNNSIMYDLVVVPSQARKDVDTMALCRILEIDTAEYRKRMVESIFKNTAVRPSVFEDLLSAEMYARLDENLWKFPGFDLVPRPVRVYPFKAGANLLGYIGEADSGVIKRSKGFYRMGDYVGLSGMEAYYEKVLMGQRGVNYMIKDNKNRLVGNWENGMYDTAAIAGRDLKTYIDVEVQQLAEKLLQNKVGAIVAIEPKTGGIIAMASGPVFDPNLLTGSERQKNFNKLFLDVSSPLLNRAIKGQYPPGSTFKPLGGLIALDEGLITPSFGYGCGGRYGACGIGKPACTHSNAGHAANLRLATANSCNSYFTHVYRMAVDNPKYGGVKKGYEHWREYMTAFGLGHRIGIDLPSEDKGNIPDTALYNKVYRGAWSSCTNLTLGIGQDMMLATPVQLANATCIIANKGYYYTPHFVEKINGETKEDTILNAFRKRHNVLTQISDTAYEAIISGMQDVVDIGTARIARVEGISMCAKTGTAQNFKVIDGKRTELNENSMFICFAPRENPKIAVAVVVENAGYGATWAGRMASLLVEKFITDSLTTERKKLADEIANKNLMPGYLVREQYKQDSIRAYNWFKLTKDTSVIKRFQRRNTPAAPPIPADGRTPVIKNTPPAINNRTTFKIKRTATAI
ncbi:MAG: penicillin-binding protein 2 [Flavihumibacter sp.]|nr:penicillin-binding protein 2 [Flavihumibacter sp.]